MDDLIDLARYPLDRPDTPEYHALVIACRARIVAGGMFELAGFMRPAAVAVAVDQAARLMATAAYRHARGHNVYFLDEVAGLAADHPALARLDTVHHTLNGRQLVGNPVTCMYEWPPFARFLADTMGKPALYCMADAVGRVNVQSSRAGEALNWHFDRAEFTTTILLQAAEAGGELEYRRGLRSAADANHAGVAAVLAGQDTAVRRLALEPGALNVFCGVDTLHRVVPVRGPTERMVAIFSFYDRPGVTMTATDQLGFYGTTG